MEVASSKLASHVRKTAPPPPAAGTGFRAFNATDRLPPDPVGTRNVMMDHAAIKSYLFPSLSSKSVKGTCRYSCNRRNIPSRGPSRRDSQLSCKRVPSRPPDPRARMLLPREGLSNRSQRSNHCRHDICYSIRSHVYVNQ